MLHGSSSARRVLEWLWMLIDNDDKRAPRVAKGIDALLAPLPAGAAAPSPSIAASSSSAIPPFPTRPGTAGPTRLLAPNNLLHNIRPSIKQEMRMLMSTDRILVSHVGSLPRSD